MVVAATAIRMVDYRPLAGALPFLTYFPAVIIAALYGGRGPGLLATLLSVVSSVFWLERPGVGMSWNLSAVSGEILFVGICVFIVWICGSVRGARERAEAGVATQARLAAIVDSSDDAIISKNLDGMVQSWNAAAARLFGYTSEEMIGTSIERLIPPDRAGEEQQILERIRRGESVDHFETVRVRKDGKRLEVSVTISPLRDGTGRVVGASKIARDIGERRQGEAERREAKRAVDASLAQLQAVVGSMSEGLIVADPQGNLLQLNQAALVMHGLSSMEEMGPNVADLAEVFELRRPGGAELPLAEWPIMRILRRETVERVEVQMRRREGGTARILSCSGTALVDVEGRVTLGVLTLHDLTEERAAQESLKMQARVLESMTEGVTVSDEEGYIIYANAAEEAMFGYAPGELLGQHVTVQNAYGEEENRRVVSEVIAQLRETGEWSGEFSNKRKDGRKFTTQANITSLEINGRAHWVCVQHDVTRRKSEERRRQFLLELNDAMRALSQPDDIMWVVVQATGRYFGASRCAYGEVDAAQGQVTVHRDYCSGLASMAGTYPMSDFGPEVVRVLEQGWTVVIADVREDARTAGKSGEAYAAVGARSMLCVPMVKDGRFVALLMTQDARPRAWSADDVSMLEEIAERTWLTVERARAQEAMRISAQRLNLAMETAELGDWVWEAATDSMTISPRAAAIFGVPVEARMTREEMRGLLHEEDRDAARAAAERAARLHQDYDVQYRVNRPDGKQVWVAAVGRGQYAKDGTIIGMLGIVQDITQRKEAEVALRESEERLRLGLEAGNTGTWDWDLLREHVTWSERVYEFHGLHEGEFSGRVEDFTKLVHPDDVERVRDAIRAALENREPYHIEFRVMHRSGEVRWISTNGKVYFNDEGRPIRMLGATTDVTARKLAEMERDRLLEVERHARVEAERSSRMKDEFLATLSHELRTPLNAILGWSQLLGRGGGDPGTLEEGLAVIERNTRAQAQLIDDLLDMSRIISGKIRLDVHSINPVVFIHAAVETVTPAARAKGIELQLALDQDAGPIPGDPSRLQQVVWNLLSNAIKFTPRGGRVTVSLERGASAVEISVTDTGQGIATEFLPHVFERFRQADASSTRRHGGLGLGLAIVKQIVELHGGTIHASSEGEGRGSTFRIDLPLAALPDQPSVEAEGEAETQAEGMPGTGMQELSRDGNELEGLKVLVVDDEPDALRLVRKLLESCGSEVLAANSAVEALGLVESQRPDVLISDVGMPDVDGYELLKRVRALGAERGGRVPAIALTAFARSEDRTRALLAGFLVHVSKPVEPDELVATVASVAGRTGQGVR
jgi:PAS domain S-box-containing protein